MTTSLIIRGEVLRGYDLTFDEFKTSELRTVFFEEIEKTISMIYQRYAFEPRSPKVLAKILEDSKEILFPGKPNVRLTFSKDVNKGRLDLNVIMNSMKIVIRKQELSIVEYLIHLAAIKCDIAFIKIK